MTTFSFGPFWAPMTTWMPIKDFSDASCFPWLGTLTWLRSLWRHPGKGSVFTPRIPQNGSWDRKIQSYTTQSPMMGKLLLTFTSLVAPKPRLPFATASNPLVNLRLSSPHELLGIEQRKHFATKLVFRLTKKGWRLFSTSSTVRLRSRRG